MLFQSENSGASLSLFRSAEPGPFSLRPGFLTRRSFRIFHSRLVLESANIREYKIGGGGGGGGGSRKREVYIYKIWRSLDREPRRGEVFFGEVWRGEDVLVGDHGRGGGGAVVQPGSHGQESIRVMDRRASCRGMDRKILLHLEIVRGGTSSLLPWSWKLRVVFLEPFFDLFVFLFFVKSRGKDRFGVEYNDNDNSKLSHEKRGGGGGGSKEKEGTEFLPFQTRIRLFFFLLYSDS